MHASPLNGVLRVYSSHPPCPSGYHAMPSQAAHSTATVTCPCARVDPIGYAPLSSTVFSTARRGRLTAKVTALLFYAQILLTQPVPMANGKIPLQTKPVCRSAEAARPSVTLGYVVH